MVLLAAPFRIPPVLGFLVTGLAIGPTGLGWVKDIERVEVFAEIGVVLLLFAIGLELDIGAAARARPAVLRRRLGAVRADRRGLRRASPRPSASRRAPRSSSVWWSACRRRRWCSSSTRPGASSARRRARSASACSSSRTSSSFPSSCWCRCWPGRSRRRPRAWRSVSAAALVAIGAVFFLARFAMPRLLSRVVALRSREVFVLGALVACLAMAWFTHSLGFSLALGAFLAGLIVSESEYSHQIVADIAPFRDLFSSIFFVSVGMLVDLSFAATHLPAIAGHRGRGGRGQGADRRGGGASRRLPAAHRDHRRLGAGADRRVLVSHHGGRPLVRAARGRAVPAAAVGLGAHACDHTAAVRRGAVAGAAARCARLVAGGGAAVLRRAALGTRGGGRLRDERQPAGEGAARGAHPVRRGRARPGHGQGSGRAGRADRLRRRHAAPDPGARRRRSRPRRGLRHLRSARDAARGRLVADLESRAPHHRAHAHGEGDRGPADDPAPTR